MNERWKQDNQSTIIILKQGQTNSLSKIMIIN
jgi:hypothetical protein